MRTTLTLDADLAERLRQLAHDRRVSFKTIVNETLRRGLRDLGVEEEPPYEVDAFDSAFRPGVDPEHLNRLLDELEIEDGVHR